MKSQVERQRERVGGIQCIHVFPSLPKFSKPAEIYLLCQFVVPKNLRKYLNGVESLKIGWYWDILHGPWCCSMFMEEIGGFVQNLELTVVVSTCFGIANHFVVSFVDKIWIGKDNNLRFTDCCPWISSYSISIITYITSNSNHLYQVLFAHIFSWLHPSSIATGF